MIGIPFLIAGTVVGEILHHRVDQDRFNHVVNVTLVAVGAVLLLSSLFPKSP
jgi:uncharacterized membrane protein YfcA